MSHTPLTEEMIDAFPAADIHVHVPGTVTPQTAWELGIRNGFVEVYKDAGGVWLWRDGTKSIGKTDPHEKYSNIFCGKGGVALKLDGGGKPIDLSYNFNFVGGGHDTFTGFDAVMATVQGHRHRPGGIQNESDYRFVMQRYLESCLAQNIRYTETSQNITIAQVLYPESSPEDARAKFFHLCKEIKEAFTAQDVHLEFYHCANKTGAANVPGALHRRSLEWVEQVKESDGVFTGLTSAGHEEMERKDGGPFAMKEAYEAAAAAGIGCEAHAGEGIGVEHLMDTIRTLPEDTRIAHGVQVIESQEAIEEVRRRGTTIIMMPCINIGLATPLHMRQEGGGKMIPHAKFRADGTRDPSVITAHIRRLEDHPFFALLRTHKLPLALASDDPEMGGASYKRQAKLLAGIGYTFPPEVKPMSAEELTLCNLNAIGAAFGKKEARKIYVDELRQWMHRHRVNVSHPLLTA